MANIVGRVPCRLEMVVLSSLCSPEMLSRLGYHCQGTAIDVRRYTHSLTSHTLNGVGVQLLGMSGGAAAEVYIGVMSRFVIVLCVVFSGCSRAESYLHQQQRGPIGLYIAMDPLPPW